MLRLVLVIFTVLTPAIVGSLLLALVHGATVFDFAPFWSDEIYYWHQIETFRTAGFDGGYYTVSERPPRAEFSHFYVWGAFFPAFYGAIASIIGWQLHTHLIINLVLLSGAIGMAIYCARLDTRALLWLAAVLATFVPILLSVPTNMQGTLQLSIGIVLAGAFYRVLAPGDKASKGFIVALAAFISLAGLIRPTWTLLLVPLFGLALEKRSAGRVWAAALAALPLVLALSILFQSTAAPYPHFRTKFSDLLTVSPPRALGAMANYAMANLEQFFVGSLYVVGLRGQVAAIAVAGSVVAIWFRRRPSKLAEPLFHAYNLASVYFTNLCLHETWDGRDYKVLAPHLLLSLVLLVSFRRHALVLAALLSGVILVPSGLQEYAAMQEFDRVTGERVGHWRARLGEFIDFDPDKNPWCNTLSHSQHYIVEDVSEPALLLGVPGGIGISWVDPRNVPSQFRARYLMLTHGDHASLQDKINAVALVDVPAGRLYLNLDTDCAN